MHSVTGERLTFAKLLAVAESVRPQKPLCVGIVAQPHLVALLQESQAELWLETYKHHGDPAPVFPWLAEIPIYPCEWLDVPWRPYFNHEELRRFLNHEIEKA